MHESQSWFEGELASFVIKGRTQLFTFTYQTVLKGREGVKARELIFLMTVACQIYPPLRHAAASD